MIRTLFLPIARHIAALVAAWLGTTVVMPDMAPGELEGALTTAALLVMLSLYACVEKLLKIPSRRMLGEQAPGDTSPPPLRRPEVP
jgi:hypothetical protein